MSSSPDIPQRAPQTAPPPRPSVPLALRRPRTGPPPLPRRHQRAIEAGDVVAGHYRIDAVLERGRGVLLDAHHTGLDKRVVLRVLPPSIVATREVGRFLRDRARLTALDSPHIAALVELESLRDGSLLLAREYVAGASLAEHARVRAGLPVDEAVMLFVQICAAVHDAHSRGVVLGDLQLAHTFVSFTGQGAAVVKITDLGIGKALRGADGDDSGTRLTRLSATAPPELIRGEEIDERADVWSLGCMLYELLVGAPAFPGEGTELMAAIASGDLPTPSAVRPELPKTFDRIVRWSLATDRGRRPRSVQALVHALWSFAPESAQSLIQRIARHAVPEQSQQSVMPEVVSTELDPDIEDSLTMVCTVVPSDAQPTLITVEHSTLQLHAPSASVSVRFDEAASEPQANSCAAPAPVAYCTDLDELWLVDSVNRIRAHRRRVAVGVVAAIACLPALVLALVLVSLREPQEATPADSPAMAQIIPVMTISVGHTASSVMQQAAAAEHVVASAPAAPEHGTLILQAVGGGCAFTVDGINRSRNVDRDRDARVKIALEPGAHTVVCGGSNGTVRSRIVEVKAGDEIVTTFGFRAE